MGGIIGGKPKAPAPPPAVAPAPRAATIGEEAATRDEAAITEDEKRRRAVGRGYQQTVFLGGSTSSGSGKSLLGD